MNQTPRDTETGRRPLTPRRVLRAAVQLADESGIDSVSMRNLADRLGVVPMALYNHVANKQELLDGMVDTIVNDIDPPADTLDWKRAVRARVLSARHVMLGHPWARQVIESRTTRTPAVLAYMDSMTGRFRAGGFSVDLTHHVMHAISRRMWGFSHELFPAPDADDSPHPDPTAQGVEMSTLADGYPYLAEIAEIVAHNGTSVLAGGCDSQFEFELTLDLLLDGFERLHHQDWTPPPAPP